MIYLVHSTSHARAQRLCELWWKAGRVKSGHRSRKLRPSQKTEPSSVASG